MRGGVAGQHLRGGIGGIDTPPTTPDVHYFRHVGTVGVTTGYLQETAYSWGSHTWEVLEGGGFTHNATHTDKLYCLPQIFPQACKVRKVLFQAPTGPSGGGLRGLRFAIYRNKRDLLVYPGDRAWVSSDYTPTFVAPKGVVIEAAPDLSVAAGELLWLAMQWSVGSEGMVSRARFSNEMLMLGGLGVGAWNSTGWAGAFQPFIGWTIPQTYVNGMPSVAPTGVGEATLGSHAAGGAAYNVPAIGFTLGVP